MVMSSECVIDDVSSKGRSSQFAHDMQYPFGMKMVALYILPSNVEVNYMPRKLRLLQRRRVS